MHVAIFPFEIERIDDAQGVFGRQIPQILADELQTASIESEAVRWFAKRGEQIAHVTLEAALPINVIQEEMEKIGATIALLGRIRVTGQDAYLSLALHGWEDAPSTDDSDAPTVIFDEECPREMLPSLVESAANTVIRLLRQNDDFFSRSGRGDTPFEAWNSLLLDMDTQELVEQRGFACLAQPDHAWTHLADALPSMPASIRSGYIELLKSRISVWVSRRHWPIAFRAQYRLTTLLKRDENEWTLLCWLAEKQRNTKVVEEALRALAIYSKDIAKASLTLGVFLASSGRYDEAEALLSPLTDHHEHADIAQTYLGITLAHRGMLPEASAYWQHVVHSGTNRDMVETARRHLYRTLAPNR